MAEIKAISVAKEIAERVKRLTEERSNWEDWWQQLAKYCIPRKARVTEEKASGQKHDTDIYDSTARDATKVFAAGLMGNLTNPATPWLKLRTKDEKLMEQPGVRDFFSQAERKVLQVFNGSNFYQQLHEFYMDIPVFGTAGFYSEEDDKEVMRYYSRPIRELLFEEDDKGRVKTVYRKFQLTAKQAFQRWGKEAGKSVIKAVKDKEFDKMMDFCQCVGERGVRDPAKTDKLNKAQHSIWVNLADQKKMAEGGFEEFPFNIARTSKIPHEKHGFSMAMDVLPDIKTANKQAYYLLRATMKACDPPVVLPHENYILPLDFNPGAVNYRLQKTGAGSEESVQVLDHKGQLTAGMEALRDTREIIKRAFFTDLFLLLADRKNMTATEVLERVEEKMLILGPVLGRLQAELLEPVVVRTFNVIVRKGLLGEVPQALQGQDFQIEYLGKHQPQRQVSPVCLLPPADHSAPYPAHIPTPSAQA